MRAAEQIDGRLYVKVIAELERDVRLNLDATDAGLAPYRNTSISTAPWSVSGWPGW